MLHYLNYKIVHVEEIVGLIVDGEFDSVVDMIVAVDGHVNFVQRIVVVDG